MSAQSFYFVKYRGFQISARAEQDHDLEGFRGTSKTDPGISISQWVQPAGDHDKTHPTYQAAIDAIISEAKAFY